MKKKKDETRLPQVHEEELSEEDLAWVSGGSALCVGAGCVNLMGGWSQGQESTAQLEAEEKHP